MMIPCWACRREIPEDQSYSLMIRERWGHHETSLGVVLCMDCRFKVSKTLAEIQEAARAASGQGEEQASPETEALHADCETMLRHVRAQRNVYNKRACRAEAELEQLRAHRS